MNDLPRCCLCGAVCLTFPYFYRARSNGYKLLKCCKRCYDESVKTLNSSNGYLSLFVTAEDGADEYAIQEVHDS